MTHIRCQVTEGLIPTERFVLIPRADGGTEEVQVWEGLVQEGYLRAGEIGRQAGRVLVELPNESTSGNWRIWVSEDAVR